jgi:uncharacterized YigZ family protein
MLLYKSLYDYGEAEYVVEKSRFIAHAMPVASLDEAKEYVASVKEEYRDATHNVPAIIVGAKQEVQWASDDGEPSGTSGLPMLKLIAGEGLTNLAVVVTRYFGGTLLGAGGLVRAYSAAAKAALDAAGFAYMEDYTLFRLAVNYSDHQKLADKLPKMGAIIDDTEFGGDVVLTIAIESSRESEIAPVVSEITCGKGSLEIVGKEERASRI